MHDQKEVGLLLAVSVDWCSSKDVMRRERRADHAVGRTGQLHVCMPSCKFGWMDGDRHAAGGFLK